MQVVRVYARRDSQITSSQDSAQSRSLPILVRTRVCIGIHDIQYSESRTDRNDYFHEFDERNSQCHDLLEDEGKDSSNSEHWHCQVTSIPLLGNPLPDKDTNPLISDHTGTYGVHA